MGSGLRGPSNLDMHEHLQYNSMNTLYGVGVSTIGNTCRLLINNMGLRRPHHSTETIQLYEFICTWGICTVKILRACTVYLSWVLGHTHAHNSMRSTLYVQSLAQAHVHVCTEYCAAFCYLLFFFFFGLSIAFSLLLFLRCKSTPSLFVEGLERDMDIFYFPFR